jgi:hypothetical protein
MKGRHTSFQRFGSGSHNPFGSVLNKYFITSDFIRKNDIYEKTASSYVVGDYGDYKAEEDLGEEVFGCIARGISTQGHLEFNTEEMTEKRKERKDVEQYVLGSEGSLLRSWEGEDKKSNKDGALIPQESLQLNVISKYPIKYSYDTTDENGDPIVEEVNIPPSAGFSGPFLYRPSKFPSSFTPTIIKEDCILKGFPASSVRIPSDVAHQMLNCTKEITFTGDVDHSIEARNKKCSGSSSQEVTQTYYLGNGCPGLPPVAKTRTASYSCTSVAETTKISCKGNISGTLSRYNLLTSLWEEEPVKLDLSPNFYQGSNAEKAYNFCVVEHLFCDCKNDSGPCPDALPYYKAEILGDKEKVTKLEAGCAVSFPLDLDIVRRDQGDNLLNKNAGEGDCTDDGTIVSTLVQYPRTHAGGFYYTYFGSANMAGKGGMMGGTIFDPTSIISSGPGLYGTYSSGLAQYVGLGGSERLFKDTNCSANELESFRSPTGAPLETGLTASMEGTCPNGLSTDGTYSRFFGSIVSYDGTDTQRAFYQWEKATGCYGSYPGCCPTCDIYGKQGTHKLACENEEQCYRNDCIDVRDPESCPPVPHPSGSGYESKCALPFQINLILERYAQTQAEETYNGIKYIQGVRVPLDVAAKNSDEQDLCLSFMLGGGYQDQDAGAFAITYPQVNDLGVSRGPPLPRGVPIVTTCKTWHESFEEPSGYKKEVIEVGTLTLKAGEWSTAVPLYTTNLSRLATECTGTDVKGISGHEGWIIGCERVTSAGCSDECDCCCTAPGCQGCGKMANNNPCNKADPCEPFVCTYSYSSTATGQDDCPQTASCGGCSECSSCDGNCDQCACCGCECGCGDYPDGYDEEDACPPYVPIPPTTHSGGGKMGCYGDAIEDEEIKTEINITMEFIPFEETGGVKQT